MKAKVIKIIVVLLLVQSVIYAIAFAGIALSFMDEGNKASEAAICAIFAALFALASRKLWKRIYNNGKV